MVRVLPYHMGYDCTFYHQYNNTHTVCTVVLALLLDILYSECMLISYRTVVRYDITYSTAGPGSLFPEPENDIFQHSGAIPPLWNILRPVMSSPRYGERLGSFGISKK
jgi:hypothetical protein